MASIGVIVFGLVVMMSGKVEMARLQPGGTHQFDYEGYIYWAKVDFWGRVSFFEARNDCENLYGAEVVKITSDKQYGAIQSEVADVIPEGWNEVVLWTSDNQTADTYQMLVIWSSAAVGNNSKVSHEPGYRGHGYICQRMDSIASTSEKTAEPSFSVTQTTGVTTSTSDDSTTPDSSATTVSSTTKTSTQPTTTTTEDPATTLPLSSTSSRPNPSRTTATDGPSMTTVSSAATTTSTQPTTTTTEDPATTTPLSSTCGNPRPTTTTDGHTRPAPKRGSCSEEYIAAMKEYKELLAEYRESFDAWKNGVNL